MADGTSLVSRIDVPTLVVIGKKDIQVDWHADGDPLQQAARGNAHVSFVFPADANHVLKHEPRPRSTLTAGDAVTNYNAPDAKLDASAMTSIIEWLTAQAAAQSPVASGA